MSRQVLARLVGGAVAVMTALAPLVVAAPAHAGQVNVTIGIQGSGFVRVVEGSLEDGGSTTCDQSQNLDHRVTLSCGRVRNEEPFEAWVWLRPSVAYSPPYWDFVEWQGCDQIRDRNGVKECGVGSDAFGTSSKAPVAVFRDTMAPTVSSLNATQGGAQGSFELTWQAAGAVLTECRRVGEPYAACSSPHQRVLPEGVHELQVRAQDQSGNVSNTPVIEVVNVDTRLVTRPAYLSTERSASFAWSTSSATSYECALDGIAVACTTEASVRLDNLGEGWHAFTVRGRRGTWTDPTPSRWDWKVDTVAPDTTIDGGPAEGGSVSSTSAELTVGSDDPGAGFGCSLDGTPVACSRGTLRLDGLAPGPHTLSVTATDNAGNVDQTPATRSWTVDTTAPSTTLTGGPANGSVLTSTTASFRLGSSEAGSTTACTLDARSRACAPGTLTLSGLAPGTHDLRVRATDRAGNTDASPATRFWTVPVPARSLVRSSGWTLSNLSRAYGGKVLTSTRRGASVSVSVRGARRIALVAGGGTTHGSVRVYVGSRLVRTVSLRTGSTVTKRVIPVTTLGSAYTGKVRVVVATSGRTVRLEGIAASTR